MNKPGINKIYYIKKSSTSFPLFFTPGTTVNISANLSAALTELVFESGSVSLQEESVKTDSGEINKVLASFVVSTITPEIHTILTTLSAEPHVFVFGDIEDQYFLCGSNFFRPVFSYKLNHITPPGSAKNYKCKINWESIHGLVFCTIP